MKILILGGTVFVGKHLVESALARGHEITLFNRGKHNGDLFPQVEKLRGDRDGGLDALRGRRWDAVIDPSGYVPRLVGDSVRLLKDHVDHYTFISSISVYPEIADMNLNEADPVATLPEDVDPKTEEITGGSYGPLKALCEAVVEAEMPGRALNIRPGLIVGPDDPTDRFTYYPVRIAAGGDVLMPGDPPGRLTQIIDVRDLAEWTIRMVEGKATGIYNATGPDYPLTWQGVAEACLRASGSNANIVWVSESFLEEKEVAPWSELPLWLPGDMLVNVQKAINAGLTFRSLEETARAILAWHQSRPADSIRFSFKKEREADILRDWRQKNS
ncbi:MAG: epimerase [Anaerolineae bacterium]|nr:epimerase [Anaerolineae bacterium]